MIGLSFFPKQREGGIGDEEWGDPGRELFGPPRLKSSRVGEAERPRGGWKGGWSEKTQGVILKPRGILDGDSGQPRFPQAYLPWEPQS